LKNLKTLSVWIDDIKTGALAQAEKRKHVFSYESKAKEVVSLTMPIRLESWVSPELHPVFQMNLPEGALLEAIRRATAKIIRFTWKRNAAGFFRGIFTWQTGSSFSGPMKKSSSKSNPCRSCCSTILNRSSAPTTLC